MTVYAKMKGNALVLPISYPSANPLGSVYTDGTNSNVLTFKDYANINTPLIGGTLISSEIFTKIKKNTSGSSIPAYTTVAVKTDGTICPAESDVPASTKVIGSTLEPISSGDYGAVRLMGASAPNMVDGMGFAPGDIIYVGSTPGSLTNAIETIIGEVKIVGIADCATDIQSSMATDLILSSGGSGGGGGGASSIFVTASATILRGYPVTINTLGQLAVVDITNEDSSYAFCGITAVDCLIGGTASLAASGNIFYDLPAAFSLTGQWGKPIFVSHTGTLTMTKPVVGIGGFLAGDYILFVGVTTKNPSSGTTDLILNPRVVGQLA